MKSTGRQICLELPVEVGESGPEPIMQMLDKREDLSPKERMESLLWLASLAGPQYLDLLETQIVLIAMSKGQIEAANFAIEIAAQYR